MLVGCIKNLSIIREQKSILFFLTPPLQLLFFVLNLETAYLPRSYDCLWQVIVKLQLKFGSCFAAENTQWMIFKIKYGWSRRPVKMRHLGKMNLVGSRNLAVSASAMRK